MKCSIFEAEQLVRRPRPEVFDFFSRAENLEALTPPWLKFHIVTRCPIEMRAGCLIDYKLRIRGIPVRWQTEITVWEPPFRFVDRQLKGPYRCWIHEHTFEEHPEGTLVKDRVQYAVLGGKLMDFLFVRRDVRTIFAYRSKRLNEVFDF